MKYNLNYFFFRKFVKIMKIFCSVMMLLKCQFHFKLYLEKIMIIS